MSRTAYTFLAIILIVFMVTITGCTFRIDPAQDGATGQPASLGTSEQSGTGISSSEDPAGSPVGNWSSFETVDPSIAHPNFTSRKVVLRLLENGNFLYGIGLKKPDGITRAIVCTGNYHSNGNSIQFSEIVVNDFPDSSKPGHTSGKLPDSSSAFDISRDGNTLDLRGGLVVDDAELQRETDDQSASGTAAPASSGNADTLVGFWSNFDFYVFDNEYGQYAKTTYFGTYYWFNKDGTYQYMSMMSGNGALDKTINEEGKYRVNGNTITVYDLIATVRDANGRITDHGKTLNHTLTYRVINRNTIGITNNMAGGVKITYTFNRDTPP